jgi:hypothetical protein
MVEITLPIMLQILQTAGILVGIAYYLVIMRNTQKTRELALNAQEQTLETRQAQLFMQLYSQWTGGIRKQWEKMRLWEWDDYDDYMEKFGDLESHMDVMTVGAFFEGIGVIVKRKLIEPSFVDDLFSGAIIRFWEKTHDIAMELRERLNYPQTYEHVEYLYHQIKPIVEQQHPELKT